MWHISDEDPKRFVFGPTGKSTWVPATGYSNRIKSCCQSLTTCRLQFSAALVLDARPPTERHPFPSTSCPIFIGFDRRLIVSAVKERHGKSLVTLHRCATDRFNWIKPVTALSCRVSFLSKMAQQSDESESSVDAILSRLSGYDPNGFAVPLAERWCWCIMMIAMDFNHCVATEGGVNEIHKSRVWFAGWWWLKMNPNDDLRRRSLPKEFAFLCVGYLCGNLKSGCTGFVTQSHLHAAVDGPSIRSPRCLYNLSNSSVCVCVIC